MNKNKKDLLKVIALFVIVSVPYVFLAFTHGEREVNSAYNNQSNCSSEEDSGCYVDYHLKTFIPLVEKVKKSNNLEECSEAKSFKDYVFFWSTTRCISDVLIYHLPDLDGNRSTIDYVGVLDSSLEDKECPLKSEAFVLQGISWESNYNTKDTNDIVCFYEYANPDEAKSVILNNSTASSSHLFVFNSTLIQYIGTNNELVNYLDNRF